MKSNLSHAQAASMTARPFLKWVGGKTQLLSELTARMPKQFQRYYEPFVGGGALFFHVSPPRATLMDINPLLVATYQVIRDRVEELIDDLGRHQYNKTYYYQIRSADRSSDFKNWSDVQKASRLIYLNKCCFNGLYRVNSRGEFNVPFGRYKSPKFLDADNLRACHVALQGAELLRGHFLDLESQIQAEDFVYFDPPYAPLSNTANFTAYSASGFTAKHQEQLRNLCCRLDAKGAYFMVSNSSAPLILDLYQEFKVESVFATRAINSQASKRGKISEVIISNF